MKRPLRSLWWRVLLLPIRRDEVWSLIFSVPLIAFTFLLYVACFTTAAGLSESGTERTG